MKTNELCVNRGCHLYRKRKGGCAYGYDIAGTCETRNDESEWIPVEARKRMRRFRKEQIKIGNFDVMGGQL